MHPAFKVLIGALMVVVGVYTSVTFWDQLLTLIQGGIGPLLVLVGAFIVWLESDEWKLRRQQKKETDQGLQQQFQPREVTQQKEETDYSEVLSGTVDEVRDQVREMDNPDYEQLIEEERQGKNRKTVIEFLERRVD